MLNLRYPLLLILLSITLTTTGCGGGSGGSSAEGGTAVTDGTPIAAPDTSNATSETPASQTPLAKQPAVQLTWEASTNEDGSPADNIGGYKVSYGAEPGKYTTTIDVGKTTTYAIQELPPGKYYFSIHAYDIWGGESAPSNEATKQVS